MRGLKIVAALASSFCAAAFAQGANPYDGRWQVSFESKQQGAAKEGAVTIAGQHGTWDLAIRSRKDPCVGRPYPIEIQRATADELVFEVTRSKTLPGCKDSTLSLKRVDDKTLAGQFESGRTITLTRE